MSKKRYVVDRKNLPRKFPIFQTVVTFLALDYWSAPEWLVGAFITIFAIGWIAAIVDLGKHNDIDVDIFAGEPDPNVPKKSWSERLAELQAKQKQS